MRIRLFVLGMVLALNLSAQTSTDVSKFLSQADEVWGMMRDLGVDPQGLRPKHNCPRTKEDVESFSPFEDVSFMSEKARDFFAGGADIMYTAAGLCYNKQDYQNATIWAQRQLFMLQFVHAGYTEDWFRAYILLIGCYERQGDYTAAGHLCIRAIRALGTLSAEDRTAMAETEGNLMSSMVPLLMSQCRWDEAIEWLKKWGKKGKEDYDTYALVNFAKIYSAKGQYTLAEDYYQKAEARATTVGQKMYLYSGKAALRMNRYDLKEAERIYFRLTDLCKEQGMRGLSLDEQLNLAYLYRLMGDRKKSKDLLIQLEKPIIEQLGKRSPTYFYWVLNLSELELDAGETDHPLRLLKNVKDSVSKAMGWKSELYFRVINMLARTYNEKYIPYYSLEKLVEADLCLKDLGKDTQIPKLWALHWLEYGNYNSLYLHHEEAIEYYQKALNSLQYRLIQDDNLYDRILTRLSDAYLADDQYAKAHTYYTQLIEHRKKQVVNAFRFMSEEQRSYYWQSINKVFTEQYPEFLWNVEEKKNVSIAAQAYDNELFVKGLLLSTNQHIRNTVLSSNDEKLKQTYHDLQMVNEELNSLLLYPSGHEKQIDSLQQLVRKLDKQLMILNEDSELQLPINLHWKDVQRRLKANEVAIEFTTASIDMGDLFGKRTEYLIAIILREGDRKPRYISVIDPDWLLKLLRGKLENIYDPSFHGEKLIWEDIAAYLHDGETIYFAPSGILHQINLSAIPTDNGVLGDRYQMVQLTSTRELLRKHAERPLQSAVLYGGLEYDMDAFLMEENSARYASSGGATRGWVSYHSALGMPYLPGTVREIQSIDTLLRHNNIETTVFEGSDGNEESFKSLSGGSHQIIHIATHGFFYQDTADCHDPLLRSGLMMAGANLAIEQGVQVLPDQVQDGRLTGREIALMDLRQADLVVLSACETGLGDVSSEGVFGLQRAFKLAGAKTLIMSLWKVDDEATSLLMTTFYEYLTSGKSKREAFRLAQKSLRTIYPDPKHWAAFVMID